MAITAYAAGSKYFGTAGRVRKKGILILQRLYIPGQFSCNVFYITILIIHCKIRHWLCVEHRKRRRVFGATQRSSVTLSVEAYRERPTILHKLKKKPFLFKRAHHKISEKSHQLTLILADKCLSVPSPRRQIPDLV